MKFAVRLLASLLVAAIGSGCRGGASAPGETGAGGSPVPDAGPAPDPGPVSTPDAGPISTPDAGPPPPDAHKVGGLGAGPWPLAPLTVYGSAQGLLERPISASTDEAENLWVVTTSALYLMRPGDKTFRRYTAMDGLHLGEPWTESPDITLVVGGKGKADPRPAIEGKRPAIPATFGQAFIGYYAHETHAPDSHMDTDPLAHKGKLDEVLLKEDMTLIVHRYDFHNSNDWHFFETREIMNAAYDHFHHPGELYVSSNHGVTRVQPENFRDPFTSAEKSFKPGVEKEYYSDHVHPWVCDGALCNSQPNGGPRSLFGDFFGLLLADDGRIWMGGNTTGAAIHWTPDLQFWRNSWKPDNPFDPFFGDGCPPIFPTAREGDPVNLRAIAETMDGKIWFASGGNVGWRLPWRGLASWEGGTQFKYYDPQSLGALEGNILELVGWEDRLVFGFPNTGLLLWKPGDAKGKRLGIGQGLPGEQIGRLYLDRMTDPPALYVPTEGGLAVFRSLP
jgi:hypothetical protein